MKFFFFLGIYVFSFSWVFAQNVRVCENFVIAINNHVATNTSGVIRFTLKEKNGTIVTIPGSYCPGGLYVNTQEDLQKIYSDTDANITLELDSHSYKHRNMEVVNYDIPIAHEWLKYAYVVCYIYDVHKKRDRKKYKDGYYVFWEFPGWAILQSK